MSISLLKQELLGFWNYDREIKHEARFRELKYRKNFYVWEKKSYLHLG